MDCCSQRCFWSRLCCARRVDRELYSNPEDQTLFKYFGYDIYITGPDVSFKIGVVERGHRTVSITIKSSLVGAGLEAKFWPYAFMQLKNAVHGYGQNDSPLKLSSGEKDNLIFLKTFDCCVLVQPPGIHAFCFKDKA